MDNSTFPLSLVLINDTGNATEDYSDYISGTLKMYIRFYMYVIIVVGLSGNTLSILVFLTTPLSQYPSSHYLTALALSDMANLLGVLHAIFAPTWVYNIPFFCQTLIYISNTFSFLSVWYVVAFTVERFIAVCYPLRRLAYCTVSRARKSIIALAVFSMLFNVYVLLLVRGSDNVCSKLPQYTVIFNIINVIDSMLTLVIPISLIVFLNLRITHHMMVMLHKPKAITHTNGASAGQPHSASYDPGETKKHGAVSFAHTKTIMKNSNARRLSTLAHKEATHRRQKNSTASMLWKEEKVTQMLLVVSVVFVVMNLPDHVMRAVARVVTITQNWSSLSPRTQSQLHMAAMVTNVIFQSNYSVNFFLYNIVGVNFRRNLKRMLKLATMKLTGRTYFQMHSSSANTTTTNTKTTTIRGSYPHRGAGVVKSSGTVKESCGPAMRSVDECCHLLPMGQKCDSDEIDLFANSVATRKTVSTISANARRVLVKRPTPNDVL